MAVTSEMRDAIIAAIANGERIVRFADGRMVEYRSVDEMVKALAIIDHELAAEGGDRTTYAVWSRD